jgi:dihydrofolate reductase
MKAIVNVDNNWGIGIGDKLLNHIPADMKFFRETTTGNVVVMGRATFMTFPGPKALPNRVNIVLTKDESWSAPDVIAVHSVEELFELLKNYDSDSVYVIGGSIVYDLLLPYCDTAYVTKVHCTPESDTFFPNLDADPAWELQEVLQSGEENGVCYEMCRYQRR